jgi:hypothetical protein
MPIRPATKVAATDIATGFFACCRTSSQVNGDPLRSPNRTAVAVSAGKIIPQIRRRARHVCPFERTTRKQL